LNNKVTLISNDKCWMESEAIAQLDRVAQLSGVVRAVGLPDLHPGGTWMYHNAVCETRKSSSVRGMMMAYILGAMK
jgi:hypothetical protein